MGTFSRFGLGTVIDDSFWGRYQGYEEILQTVSFNPNFAYKVNDRFSVAFGVEAMYLDLVYRRMADANAVLAAAGLPVEFNNPETTATDVDSKLDVDSMGLGVNLALHYQMTDKVAVGASYRSQVHQDASGRHTFDVSPGAAATLAAVGADVFNSAHVKGSVTLPDMISAGISYKYSDTLDFEFDVVFTRWSTYEDFTVEYDTLDAIGSYQSVSEKNWEDTFRFQFGMEYQATDWATLRCGYVYDQSPIRAGYADYMVPTNDRQLINLGAGFKLSEQSVLDLSYTYLVSESRTFGPRMTEGVLDSETAEGRAHIIGVSFSYAF